MDRRPNCWKPNVSDRALRKRRNRPGRGGVPYKREQLRLDAARLLPLLRKFVPDPLRPHLAAILAESSLKGSYDFIPSSPHFQECRDLWATRCPRRQRRRNEKRRRAALSRLKQMKGCASCGENDYRCLDFHHLDPTQKRWNIAKMYMYSKPLLKAELKKCQVLCSNCHRKIQKRS